MFGAFWARFELEGVEPQPVVFEPSGIAVEVGVIGVVAVSRIGDGEVQLLYVMGDVDVQKLPFPERELPFEDFAGDMADRLFGEGKIGNGLGEGAPIPSPLRPSLNR